MTDLKHITIYTDGACTGNPGPGGYGIILQHGEKRREISAGFRLTTNNRMELTAAIVGLKILRYRCAVTIYTDSQYVVKGITLGWAKRWRANGWRRNAQEKAINADLWGELLDQCAEHEVTFEWVKGHANHPENERCDRLAVLAAQGKDLPRDDGYDSAASNAVP
jgi:ribonuclease HI